MQHLAQALDVLVAVETVEIVLEAIGGRPTGYHGSDHRRLALGTDLRDKLHFFELLLLGYVHFHIDSSLNLEALNRFGVIAKQVAAPEGLFRLARELPDPGKLELRVSKISPS